MNVRHDPVEAAKEVVVTYSTGGKLFDVRGRACVMACWNMFIPYLTPDLPATQKEALMYGVKGPLVYTSVALRNWTAFQKRLEHLHADDVPRQHGIVRKPSTWATCITRATLTSRL